MFIWTCERVFDVSRSSITIGTLPPAPHCPVLGPTGNGIWNPKSSPGVTRMSLSRALSHLILYKILAGDHTHSRDSVSSSLSLGSAT